MLLVNKREVFWGPSHDGGTFSSGELRPVRSYFVSQGKNTVELRFLTGGGHDEELMYLWYIAKDLRELAYGAENTLVIPFLPNGRTNKEIRSEINIVPKLMEYLRSLDFDRIIVHEPHSASFVADYDDFIQFTYPTMDYLQLALYRESKYGALDSTAKIVFPDAGAYQRYKKLISEKLLARAIVMNKTRSQSGDVYLEIVSGGVRENARYLIVDDICDSGETAAAAVNLIRREHRERFNNTTRVAMLVAHLFREAIQSGIFNPEDDAFIDRVYVAEDVIEFPALDTPPLKEPMFLCRMPEEVVLEDMPDDILTGDISDDAPLIGEVVKLEENT